MLVMDLQHFGGGGSSSGAQGSSGMTDEQVKAVMRIANRTRAYKNEQYRVINEAGEVVLEKRGDAESVGSTMGEKRDNLPGAVSIHNHPHGGPFSKEDLPEFGFGARAMFVATSEGTYMLENVKYGTWEQRQGWRAMQEALEKLDETRPKSYFQVRDMAVKAPRVVRISNKLNKVAEEMLKYHRAGQRDKVARIRVEYDALHKRYEQARDAEIRRIEVKPYHDFYRKNAHKYGFRYTFVKAKK